MKMNPDSEMNSISSMRESEMAPPSELPKMEALEQKKEFFRYNEKGPITGP